MRRRIVVGDIQGCCAELDRLLDEVGFDPELDRLYSVGDVVNRGPDSAGALRRLIELGATAVLGNHDLHYLEVAAGRRSSSRRDTVQDLLDAPDRVWLERWIRRMPLVHVEDDFVLVHAAMHPSWRNVEVVADRLNRRVQRLLVSGAALEDPDIEFAVRARYCDPEGRLPERDWPEPEPPFEPWDRHWRGRRVVFGHWARRGLVVTDRVRGLDTGCVYGGRLSAWIAEEDRIVQVPAARAYCPVD